MQSRPIDSSFHEFRLDYFEHMDHLDLGKIVSDPFSAGGHMWRIGIGHTKLTLRQRQLDPYDDDGKNFSVFIQLVSQTGPSIRAIFEVFLMDRGGQPSSTAHKRTGTHYMTQGSGWSHVAKWTDTEAIDHIKDGHIRILCGIMVVDDDSIPIPPSNLVEHLGTLLHSADGTDVSFIVGNETFNAHRALLAARSPVFRAELLGSMAEATMASITLHDIAPATFKLMLGFMYTDIFPEDDEFGKCPFEMICDLLAAADRYALDRLKLFCARKLWDIVSIDTVAATLACAEMYNCSELKIKCIAMERNTLALTPNKRTSPKDQS